MSRPSYKAMYLAEKYKVNSLENESENANRNLDKMIDILKGVTKATQDSHGYKFANIPSIMNDCWHTGSCLGKKSHEVLCLIRNNHGA